MAVQMMAVLQLVQGMSSLAGGQQQKDQQNAAALGAKKKATLLPASSSYAPTSTVGKGGGVGFTPMPATAPYDLSGVGQKQPLQSGSPDLGAIMSLFSAFSAMKGKPQTQSQLGDSGGFFKGANNYESPAYNSAGLNGAFTDYQNYQLSGMNFGGY